MRAGVIDPASWSDSLLLLHYRPSPVCFPTVFAAKSNLQQLDRSENESFMDDIPSAESTLSPPIRDLLTSLYIACYPFCSDVILEQEPT